MPKDNARRDDMDWKGVFIPEVLWTHNSLSWTARIILVQIFYLSKNGAGCYASNASLAGFLGLTENYVRNLISKLTADGYIHQASKKRGRLMYVTCKTGLIPPQDCLSMSQNCDIEHPSTSQKSDIEPDSISQKSDIADSMSQKKAAMSQKKAAMSQICDHKYKYKEEEKKDTCTALSIYHEVWPDMKLDIFSTERLEAFEIDPDIWRATVQLWGTNSYSPRSIAQMMDLYAKKKAEADAAAKPENTAMVYCDECRDTSGLVKIDGGWVRCKH